MTDQPRPTRRAILKHALAGAAAASLAHVASAAEPTFPIIDTHQHLWDLTQLNLPWLAHDPLLHRNYLPADYITATTGLDVAQAVYMEVAVPPEQRSAEVDYILKVCDRHDGPTTAAVIGGNPADEAFRAYADRLKKDRRIKGVRCSLPADASNNPIFVDNVRYLGQIGWRFDLLPDPTKLKDAAKLVGLCPDTRFILDHCGNASTAFYADPKLTERRAAWEEGLAALADQKNIICKISGVCEAGPPALAKVDHAVPVVNRCLDRFGSDRLIFAGNWPVCLKAVTFKEWVIMLRAITAERNDTFRRKLFHDNAKAFYELS